MDVRFSGCFQCRCLCTCLWGETCSIQDKWAGHNDRSKLRTLNFSRDIFFAWQCSRCGIKEARKTAADPHPAHYSHVDLPSRLCAQDWQKIIVAHPGLENTTCFENQASNLYKALIPSKCLAYNPYLLTWIWLSAFPFLAWPRASPNPDLSCL